MLTFKTPESLDEADKRIEGLIQIYDTITLDLSCKNRTDKLGRRLRPYSYHEWRQRALHSLNRTLTELRFLKTWKEQKIRDSVHEDETGDLLLKAYRIINKHPAIENADAEKWEDIKNYVEEWLLCGGL